MKVALVGCGCAGTRHAQAFRAARAELAWAVDVGRAQRRNLELVLAAYASMSAGAPVSVAG